MLMLMHTATATNTFLPAKGSCAIATTSAPQCTRAASDGFPPATPSLAHVQDYIVCKMEAIVSKAVYDITNQMNETGRWVGGSSLGVVWALWGAHCGRRDLPAPAAAPSAAAPLAAGLS